MKMLMSLTMLGLGFWAQTSAADVSCTAASPINNGTVVLERIQNIGSTTGAIYIRSLSDVQNPEKLQTLSDQAVQLKPTAPMPLQISPMPTGTKAYPTFVGEIAKNGDGPLPATMTIILAEDLRGAYGTFKGQMIINDPGIAQPPTDLICIKTH